jgi:hypothetical protein
MDDFLMHIEGFGGTSIGALMALLLLLKIPIEHFEERFSTIIRYPQRIVAGPDIVKLIHHFGLDNGEMLRQIIGDIIQFGGLDRNILMKDIKRILNREYACCATCLQTHEKMYMTSETTPDMSVVDAVYMSMCVPIVFTPCSYQDKLYIDGTFVENLPDLFPREATLYFNLEKPETPSVIDNWYAYLNAIQECGNYKRQHDHEKNIYKEHGERVITLGMPHELCSACPMNLEMTEHDIQQRRMSGYASMLAYLYPQFIPTIHLVLLFVCIGLVDVHQNEKNGCEEEFGPNVLF